MSIAAHWACASSCGSEGVGADCPSALERNECKWGAQTAKRGGKLRPDRDRKCQPEGQVLLPAGATAGFPS